MSHKYALLTLLGIALCSSVAGQDLYQRNLDADVEGYVFSLTLNDKDNEIYGEAEITVDFKKETKIFNLDLIGENGGYGMELIEVLENGEKARYNYDKQKIKIVPTLDSTLTATYKVIYKGIPEKGLVIDKTKYGQRSFFGDNWPNLARYWIPCVDHPYDKASVKFQITAPNYYEVVATGKKIQERKVGRGMKLTSYEENAPVATKVMTIGVTRFAKKDLGSVGDIPVTAWVYPENSIEGFRDFQEATDILAYFVDKIGPYSYAKLANMQVKTAWGGLENAGTISYNEKSITGRKEIQGLMAHEIAHQWFGNSVTENNWNHVWLSEGFATYFSILYQESVEGNDKRKQELIQDRKEVIEYYQKTASSVVDLTISDPKKVLSRNTYQKGGWVLNMLRHHLGDDIFWNGIRAYYKKFQDSNAMSSDFQLVMEEISGQELDEFFDQWLYKKGYPELKWNWKYTNGTLKIMVKQKQKHYKFKFPIEFGIVINGQMKIETLEVSDTSASIEIQVSEKPDKVLIDPEVWLLFEEK